MQVLNVSSLCGKVPAEMLGKFMPTATELFHVQVMVPFSRQML